VSGAQRVERIGDATLYLGDCRDVLPMLGPVDAVVTDPPYGTGCAPRGGRMAGTINFTAISILPWDVLDTSWIKDVSCAVAAFCHPATTPVIGTAMRSDGLLVYVKSNPSPFGTSVETCVTRGFRRSGPQHIVAYNAFNGQLHPTQKPVEVMEFVCERAPAGVILDPFMGSGTTGVACARLGRRFIGVEINENYFNIAVKRIEQAYRQPDLFVQRPAPKAPVIPDLFA
jgi:hypothetical protein